MSSEKHVIFGPLVLKWPKLDGQSTNFGLNTLSPWVCSKSISSYSSIALL